MEKKDLSKLTDEELLAKKKGIKKFKNYLCNTNWISCWNSHFRNCCLESLFGKTGGISYPVAVSHFYHLQTA